MDCLGHVEQVTRSYPERLLIGSEVLAHVHQFDVGLQRPPDPPTPVRRVEDTQRSSTTSCPDMWPGCSWQKYR